VKSGWSTEARVVRSPEDKCQVLPQLLDKAEWVHVCVSPRLRAGATKPVREWCGVRHSTMAEAREHADALNMSEVRA
jgi:hypothetical protein